jgi:uncharacterized protein YaeQ
MPSPADDRALADNASPRPAVDRCGTVTPFRPPGCPLALKSTIYKAALQIADMDRGLYADHALTLALHPSETHERLMVRVLAFALCVPVDDHDGALLFARGLSDGDEPDLWRHALDGTLREWIEVGQPDERRILRACGRAGRVAIWAYAASTPIWWQGLANRLTRQKNLQVWQVPAEQSQALGALAERSMQLQINVQEGQVLVVQGERMVEVHPRALHPAP